MENVRTIFMDQNAVRIEMIEGVASNVKSFVDHKHLLLKGSRHLLGNDGAGETRSDN
jgi:hypothetical protein